MSPPPSAGAASRFTPEQVRVVALLGALQFTVILDFMILSPLGAILMPALKIAPSQFGLVVSAYAFSAGLSGLLAAGFADKFDRKKLLLFFYAGFLVGTLLCGLAPTYPLLLMARIVTGFFGGVIGSISFAIATDLFPLSMRGRVMGVVQTAFGASQVMGIPAGLYLSNHWGWQMPFRVIVGLGLLLGLAIVLVLPPIDAHLKLNTGRNPFRHLLETVTNARYLQGFGAMALLATGGFMLMPFGSAFSVKNLGIPVEKLPIIYFVTGLFALVAGPLAGKLSDTFGKLRIFMAGSVLTMIMVIIYTHLGVTPIPAVILVSVVMFMAVSARMVSSQALISAIPEPASRGSFMSVNSSIQQVSGGIAAAVAGWIIVDPSTGPLQHFEVIGYVVVGATLTTMLMMSLIGRGVRAKVSAAQGVEVAPSEV